jgi:hypothetical protein
VRPSTLRGGALHGSFLSAECHQPLALRPYFGQSQAFGTIFKTAEHCAALKGPYRVYFVEKLLLF